MTGSQTVGGRFRPRDLLRLRKLADKLETTRSEILRIAIKRMAAQEGIEQK